MRGLLVTVYLFALGFVLLFVAFNWPPSGASFGSLIGMLLVFGPWLVGGCLGWLWGRTWLRVAGVVALGLFLTAASLAAILFLLGSSEDAACGEDECLHYLGHWIEAYFATKWPIYAAVAWTFSAIVLSQRRFSHQRKTDALSES